jgi:hypothetical protein
MWVLIIFWFNSTIPNVVATSSSITQIEGLSEKQCYSMATQLGTKATAVALTGNLKMTCIHKTAGLK